MSTPDVGVSREEAIANCKSSLDFFAAVCVPEVFRFPYPPVLKAVWQLLVEAAHRPTGKERYAIGIPRGFSKTLLLKLLVVYLICFTDRRFILIICNTATLAENFVSDVSDILSSSNFIRIFGDWRYTLEKDTQELKKFSFRGRSITLAGLGSGSSLRGLNIKFVRPDVILMDDMQSKEQAASEVEAVKLLSWMLGTLMKAADTGRCLYTFVGNMYPFEGSILRKLKVNAAWISFITGAILEDGNSLWPDLRSVDDILLELENDESMGHPEIFYSEVMNDEVAGSRSGIDFDKINVWRPEMPPDGDAQGGFVIIDPSGTKKKSDATAIGTVLIYDGEPMLRRLEVGKFTEGRKIEIMISMAAHFGLQVLVVEGVAYQASLIYWIEQKKQQLGLTSLRVVEVSPRGMNKNARIVAALKLLTASKERIWLHPEVRSQVTHEITYFDPIRTNNVDNILDLLGYFYQVIAENKYTLLRPFEMQGEEISAAFSDELIEQLEF